MGLGLGTRLEPHQMGSRDEPQGTAAPLPCLTQIWIVSGDCLPTDRVGLGGGTGGTEGSRVKAMEETGL